MKSIETQTHYKQATSGSQRIDDLPTANHGRSLMRTTLKFLWTISWISVLLAAGVYLWASSHTETSLVARGIMWGDADVDDWQRFPARTIHASPEPIQFETQTTTWLDEIRVEDTDTLPHYLERTNTTAFIILQGDTILYEGYFNGSNQESIQTSFSVAKSFASTLVGIAIDEGAIASIDDPVTVYLPELRQANPRFEQITVRHLLTMSSGLDYDVTSEPFNDDFITYYSPDLRSVGLSSQITDLPGTEFKYNNYNPLLIGMILERATGMTVSTYLESRLWQPMGAEGDATWSLDSRQSGFEKMESGLNARAIDFVKLGWIYLHRGRQGDQPIVPSAWIEQATRVDSATDPAGHYQYFWWVDEVNQAYYAEGNMCQFIYVYPQADLVIARFGKDCGGTGWIGFLGNLAGWIEENSTALSTQEPLGF